MKRWKEIFLQYFDFNENKSLDWWEYTIPFGIILILEIIANLIANLITK